MTFKLTYATMFDPPEELHARFDSAMQRVRGALGGSHPLYIAGADRPAERSADTRAPADRDELIGRFAAASAADRAWPEWKRTPAARRAQLLRQVGRLLEERVYDIAAALTLEVGKNRME